MRGEESVCGAWRLCKDENLGVCCLQTGSVRRESLSYTDIN